ncbi:MAG: ankyrin repeat domain-containing protein [Planctomycetaceae bacterium]
MEIDAEIYIPIKQAFDSNDLVAFRRLLGEHPQYLRDVRDGTDWWMWKAAMDGNLPIVQTLIDLGLRPNESQDLPDPEDPDFLFVQVEGPILQAAGQGHFDVVAYLLEQGAQINYEISGKVRCLPLLRAATKGHLEVVKLLVEHGADLNFTFNGHTPVSQADDYGHAEVAAYLRSVGAK